MRHSGGRGLLAAASAALAHIRATVRPPSWSSHRGGLPDRGVTVPASGEAPEPGAGWLATGIAGAENGLRTGAAPGGNGLSANGSPGGTGDACGNCPADSPDPTPGAVVPCAYSTSESWRMLTRARPA